MKTAISIAKQCCCRETCFAGDQKKWSPTNPTTGHCAVISLLLYDLFGGEVCKTTVNRHTHYFNRFGETIVDATAEQFGDVKINYSKYTVCNPQNMLKNKDTKRRFQQLHNKFATMQQEEMKDEKSINRDTHA